MMKILIVDDQAVWRKFHANAIYEIFGKDIILDTADSGQEGYSKILENKNAPYDFILTDMQMESDYLPKMAGEWFIEQVQQLSAYYKTRIIIISAAPMILWTRSSVTVIMKVAGRLSPCAAFCNMEYYLFHNCCRCV